MSEEQEDIVKDDYMDLYSTDIEVVRKHVASSTRYMNLITPDVIVEVNGHFNEKEFIRYVHRLPYEQLKMIMRYQNIIDNEKYIQKYLSKKNNNEEENMELLNWLIMNYDDYIDTFFPKESNDDEDFDETNM